MRNISYREYKRRVFNETLLEAMCKFTLKCCNIDPEKNFDLAKNACDMTKAFYSDLIGLDKQTIDQTTKVLNGCSSFVKDCINVSESIAEFKKREAEEENLEIPEEQKTELSEEDKAVIDTLYDTKNPELQIDAVRDATVKAMIAEDKKAQEIKDSLSIAQSKVAAGEDPKVMEETVNMISAKGPTSLMNGIMNRFTSVTVRNKMNESSTPRPIGEIMQENAEEIRNNAMIMYSLFEASSVLGIHKYAKAELKEIAQKFYYTK